MKGLKRFLKSMIVKKPPTQLEIDLNRRVHPDRELFKGNKGFLDAADGNEHEYPAKTTMEILAFMGLTLLEGVQCLQKTVGL